MEQDERQTFTGVTLAEAMLAMKAALGPHGVPVGTPRKVRRGGFFGFGGRELIQITGERLPDWLIRPETRPRRERPVTPAVRTQSTLSDPLVRVIEAAISQERQKRGTTAAPPRRRRNAEIERQVAPAVDRRANARGWLADEPVRPVVEAKAGPPDSTTTADPSPVADFRLKGYMRQAAATRPAPAAPPAYPGRARRPATAAPAPRPLPPTAIVSPARSRDEARRPEPLRPADAPAPYESLRREMIDLKRAVETLTAVSPKAGNAFAGCLARYHSRLIAAGVDEALARGVVEKVKERSQPIEWEDEPIMRARIVKELNRMIRIAATPAPDPLKPRLLMAVGATGVGKTTTLAKLGSILLEEEARRIAYVTLDNYRIGGADHLHAYADILRVACDKASTADDLQTLMEQHGDKEFVLLDTAGRSPYSPEAASPLRCLLGDAGLDCQLLIFISAATEPREMEKVIERYAFTRNAALVFTKVDETSRWGPLFMAAHRSQLPIAYLTTGQNVPDDIEPAIAGRIADALLAEPGEVREARA